MILKTPQFIGAFCRLGTIKYFVALEFAKSYTQCKWLHIKHDLTLVK